jgi:hypothetical protein
MRGDQELRGSSRFFGIQTRIRVKDFVRRSMAKHAFLQKVKLKVMPENAGCAVINCNLSPYQANEARGYRWRWRVSRRGGPCAKVREAQIGDAAA